MNRRGFFTKAFASVLAGAGAVLRKHEPDELADLDKIMLESFPTSLLVKRDGAYFRYDSETRSFKHLYTPMSSIQNDLILRQYARTVTDYS